MKALETPRPTAVLFEFPAAPERMECWGRLLELGSDEGLLLCQARVARGELLRLRFELPGGAPVRGLEADATRVRTDEDGYCRARLVWRSGTARLRLGRDLLALFASV